MKKSYYIFLLLAFLPIMMLRDITPDNELRYLSIAEEALRNGNLFTFFNQGVAYADKPPLYLWIVMLGKVLFGNHVTLFLSLFSMIPALVIVGVMNQWCKKALTEMQRFTSSLLLMTSGLFLGLAVTLRMDMLMCMFITLALYTFYRMYEGNSNSKRLSFQFPLYIFLALFSKGPVGILVPLLSTLTFLLLQKKRHEIGRYWGWKTWGILLLGSLIWFGCVFYEGGIEYLYNLVFNQTANRAVNAFTHQEPFYYYGISFWYSLAPWSLLFFTTLVLAIKRKLITDNLSKFFLTIVAVTFVMLSCISSKIAVYLLPAFPFIVYFSMLMLVKMHANRWLKASVMIPAVIYILSFPLILILPGRIHSMSYLKNGWIYAACLILMISGTFAFIRLLRSHKLLGALRILTIGLLLAIFTGGWGIPAFNDYLGFSRICKKGVELAEAHQTHTYYSLGIRRPANMDVYLGEDVTKLHKDSIQTGRPQEGILFVSTKLFNNNETIHHWLENKEQFVYGDYLVVAL